jgi:hypothetical protein
MCDAIKKWKSLLVDNGLNEILCYGLRCDDEMYSPNLGMTGYKTPPTTWDEFKSYYKTDDMGSIRIDAHAWCENANGIVSDYTDDDEGFRNIRRINGLKPGKQYHSMKGEERQKMWRFLWKKVIRPRLKVLYEFPADIRNETIKDWLCEAGNCFMRAYILSLVGFEGENDMNDDGFEKVLKCESYEELIALPAKAKIQFGSMGWRGVDDEVWWEYG